MPIPPAAPFAVKTCAFTALSLRRQRKGPPKPPYPLIPEGGHGFQSINGRLLGFEAECDPDAMLIVCPSCATSYMIDPASLGAAGRTVRCTRCKTSWFAGGPEAAPNWPPSPKPSRPKPRSSRRTPPAPNRRRHRPAAAGDRTASEAEPAPAPPRRPRRRRSNRRPRPPQPATLAEPPAAPEAAQGAEPEPVTITDAPPLAPPNDHEVRPEAADAEPEADAAVAFDARRRALQARRKKSRRSSRWTAVVLVLVAFNVAMIGARNEVVRYLPQTASLFAAIGLPVNLRNLKFENVKLSTEAARRHHHADRARRRSSAKPAKRSPCRACALPCAMRPARRSTPGPWRRRAASWSRARRLEFRSQIPVPNGDATDVLVRFLTAQDAGSEIARWRKS